MDKDRILLKIAGISYGIMGVLLLGSPLYGIILMLIGLYFFVQANEPEEVIYQNRVVHYILTAIGISNILGFVLVFITQDNISKRYRIANGINAPPKVVYKVDKESKKIDILLKLGVAMVFISGVLFATTTWDFISNYVKALALVIMGTIFLFLALFTERKLKLYRTSYTYWLLSISLYFLTIIGIHYFGVFGEAVTYDGSAYHLAYAITFLAGAGFTFTTYLKYPKKYLLYITYAGLVAGLANVFAFMNLSTPMVISMISVIVMITNIINKKQGTISTFSKLLSYLLFAFIIVSETEGIDTTIACVINILNLNYLAFMDKNREETIVNVILTFILIYFGFYQLESFLEGCNYLMVALASTVYILMILGHMIPTKKFTYRTSYIVYCIVMLILFSATSIEYDYMYDNIYIITCIIIPVLHLLVNSLMKFGIWKVEPWKFANFIQPALIFGLVDAAITASNDTITPVMGIAILSVVYSILHFANKKPLNKSILLGYLITSIIIKLLMDYDLTDIYSTILVVISSLYLFTTYYLKEEEKTSTKWLLGITYLILLSSLYFPFVYNNILELEIMIPSLILIILILVMALLLRTDLIKKLSYLYIILPLLTLIEMSGLDYGLVEVLKSATGLYIIFLIIMFFIKNKLATNIVAILGIAFFSLQVFFINELIVGIYLGVLGLLVILIGYREDEYYPIFITGIVLTILNIVYRLKDVWKLIPFWLYLLIGGLSIIGLVTYKEIKKQKK